MKSPRIGYSSLMNLTWIPRALEPILARQVALSDKPGRPFVAIGHRGQYTWPNAWAYAQAMGRPSEEVASYLRRGLEDSLATKYAYLTADDTYRIRLTDDIVRTLPRRTRNEGLSLLALRWSLLLASILRDAGAIDLLCRFDDEWLSATPQGKTPRALDADSRLIRAIIQRDARAPELLAEAVEATDPDQVREQFAGEGTDLQEQIIDGILHEEAPRHEMILAVFDRDEARFNKRLARAVRLHKELLAIECKRWPEEVGTVRSHHVFSLPLIGLCAIAHDLGIHTTVQSDYLPLDLIEGKHTSDVTKIFIDGLHYGELHYGEPPRVAR